jgi:hypothetical protein
VNWTISCGNGLEGMLELSMGMVERLGWKQDENQQNKFSHGYATPTTIGRMIGRVTWAAAPVDILTLNLRTL